MKNAKGVPGMVVSYNVLITRASTKHRIMRICSIWELFSQNEKTGFWDVM